MSIKDELPGNDMPAVAAPELDRVERAIPSVGSKHKGGQSKTVPIIAGALLLVALIAVNGGFSKKKSDKATDAVEETRSPNKRETIGASLPRIREPAETAPEVVIPVVTMPEVTESKPIAEPPKEQPKQPSGMLTTSDLAPALPPAPITRTDSVTPGDQQIMTPAQRKRDSSVFGDGKQDRDARRRDDAATLAAAQAQVDEGASPGGAPEEPISALKSNLTATKLDGVSAARMPNLDLMLGAGSFIDCTLREAIDSTVPGLLSCITSNDVYSDSGRVLLLERGSVVRGQYQSGLKQGQARLFVLWTSVRTPNGVVVSLDSPGTDALGRGGVSGYVDNHFWQRFGGAIMLSLIDDVGAYAAAKAQDGDSISFAGTSESAKNAAGIALENSVNIPPSLAKNQGDHINIYVARDLDFRGVYGLELAN